jgi:hypothetical protein
MALANGVAMGLRRMGSRRLLALPSPRVFACVESGVSKRQTLAAQHSVLASSSWTRRAASQAMASLASPPPEA